MDRGLKIFKSEKFQVMAAMLLSCMAMGVNYLISLLLTPYITSTLGTDVYGFVTLAKTVANYGIIITSCLNAFAARFIVVAYHEGDLQKANRYYSSVLLANFGILIIFSLVAFVFVQNMHYLFKIPQGIYADVKLLFFLDIVNYLLIAVANVFTVSAYIKNRLVYVNGILILTYLTEAAALILLFRNFDPRCFYVGIALLSSTLVLGIANFTLKHSLTPELKCSFHSYSFAAVKELLGKGFWNAFNQVGNLLNTGLDLWVTNLMLTDHAMGQLSIVKTVAVIFSSLPKLVSSPFQPMLLKAYADRNRDKVVKTLKLEMKLVGLCGFLLLVGFVTLGVSYFDLWTKGEDSHLLYGIAIVTLVGFVFEGMANPLFYVYALTLKNEVPCIVTIISGLLNVGGMYMLLKYTGLGLFAVVGTTTVLGFFTFCIFTPLYAAKCLDLPKHSFVPVMLRIGGFTFAAAFLLHLLTGSIAVSGWGSFVLIALLEVAVGAPLYLLAVLGREEWKVFLGRFLRKKG